MRLPSLGGAAPALISRQHEGMRCVVRTFPRGSRPWLLTTAARGGLGSATRSPNSKGPIQLRVPVWTGDARDTRPSANLQLPGRISRCSAFDGRQKPCLRVGIEGHWPRAWPTPRECIQKAWPCHVSAHSDRHRPSSSVPRPRAPAASWPRSARRSESKGSTAPPCRSAISPRLPFWLLPRRECAISSSCHSRPTRPRPAVSRWPGRRVLAHSPVPVLICK
jgi:hypothetical protein